MQRLNRKRLLQVIAFSFLTIFMFSAKAREFSLPPSSESLIGNLQYIYSGTGQTPTSIAMQYNLGLNAVVAANPGTTETMLVTNNGYLVIASEFLLPPLPRKGIVINLPEMRMYYYPAGSGSVMTFPVGIGKVGKTIPITNTVVVRKVVDPVWTPTPAIRQFNEDQGITLPAYIPAGPDNPLGPYAIYLRVPTYLIHSTIFPESIGRRASFGCIRMNEWDIEQFFPSVTPGTPVAIINMPNKIGWEDNDLYLEAHPPLIEHSTEANTGLNYVVVSIANTIPRNSVTIVDWQMVAHLISEPDGIPHQIGVRVR